LTTFNSELAQINVLAKMTGVDKFKKNKLFLFSIVTV